MGKLAVKASNKSVGSEAILKVLNSIRDRENEPTSVPSPYDSSMPPSPDSYDSETLYDGYEMKSLKTKKGYSNQFAYRPENFVEYSIAQKAIADMVEDTSHFQCDSSGVLEIGINQTQEIVRGGLLCFIDSETQSLVTIRAMTDPDTSIYVVLFNSYNVYALRRILKKYKKLCALSNFYKGKHLKLLHPGCKPPIKFLPEPVASRIYGFEKVQASIVLNTINFFNCKEAHLIAPQRGILLYGNPGSGKSSLVCKTKAECIKEGITVLDFDSDAMQHTAYWYTLIEQWFAPALVVLEDFDLVAMNRNTVSSSNTTDLLASLNGNMKKKLPIVTIATTNRLESLDSAVIRARRMDKIYEVSGLDPKYQMELFVQKNLDICEPLLQKAVDSLGKDGTGADVEEISASTVIYKSTGMDKEEAFKQALTEWEEGHAAKKKGKLGFGS